MLAFSRDSIIPFFLGLALLVASFIGADWSVWVEACIGVLIIIFIVFSRHISTLSVSWQQPERWFLLLLAALAIMSLWSTNVYATIRGYSYIFIGYTIYRAARSLTERQVYNLLVWTHVVMGLHAAWGLVAQFLTPVDRTQGLLGNANAFGALLALGLPVGIAVSLRTRGWLRVLSWLGVAITALALARTYSLTAFFGLIVSGVFVMCAVRVWRFFKVRQWKPYVLFGSGVIVAALGSVMTLRTIETGSFTEGLRVDKVITRTHLQTSFEQRWRFVQATTAMLADRPLTGFGLGAFQSTFPRYASTTFELPRYAHNHFLELAAEAGLLAAMLFGVLIFRVCQQAFRAREGSIRKTPHTIILWGLAGSVVSAFVDFGWHFIAVWVLWWFLAGVLQPTVSQPTKRTPVEYAALSFIMLLGVFLLLRGLGVATAHNAFQRAENNLTDGMLEEAIPRYIYGLRYDPNPYYRGRLAVAHWAGARGDVAKLTEAQAQVERILRWNTYDHFAYQLQGRIAFSAKDFVLADAAFRKAVEYDNNFHLDITAEYANFLIAQNRFADAFRLTEQVLAVISPNVWSVNPRFAADLERLRALNEQARARVDNAMN